MAKSTFTLEWDAHEYEHKERSADWFWVAGIITAALAVVSFIFGNVILGLLILISAFSLSLYINRPPKTLHMTLTEEGIRRDNILYPMNTLESFWIDVEHPHNKIIFRSKKKFMPLIVIPLSDKIDPEKLQKLLLNYMTEEYHSLPLPEKILEYLGF